MVALLSVKRHNYGQFGTDSICTGKGRVDKIRKFGAWLWLNKERMVFAVLALFLCFRVYVVIEVSDPEPGKNDEDNVVILPPEPSGPVPDIPDVPPLIPVIPDGTPLYSISSNNPFSYIKGAERDESGELKIDIELLEITPERGGSGFRARMKSPTGRRRIYKEGMEIGDWMVDRIEKDSVAVTNTVTGKRKVLAVSDE
jgi:hypothetical protein